MWSINVIFACIFSLGSCKDCDISQIQSYNTEEMPPTIWYNVDLEPQHDQVFGSKLYSFRHLTYRRQSSSNLIQLVHWIFFTACNLQLVNPPYLERGSSNFGGFIKKILIKVMTTKVRPKWCRRYESSVTYIRLLWRT